MKFEVTHAQDTRKPVAFIRKRPLGTGDQLVMDMKDQAGLNGVGNGIIEDGIIKRNGSAPAARIFQSDYTPIYAGDSVTITF